MSEFIPNPPERNAEDGRFARTALSDTRGEKRSLWTFWSLVFHGIAIGALVFFAYHRATLDEKIRKKAQKELSTERVEKLSQHIKQANLEELRKNVEDILKSKAQIEELMPARNKVYAAFSQEMLQRDGSNNDAVMAAAVKYTREAGEALERWQRRQREFDELAFGPGKSQVGQVGAVQAGLQAARNSGDELAVALTAAENALEKAFNTASWTTPPQEIQILEALFQELGTLRERQKKAATLLSQLEEAGLASPELNTAVQNMRKDVEQLQKLLEERRTASQGAEKELAARTLEVKQAQTALEAAQKAGKAGAEEAALYEAQRKQTLARVMLDRMRRNEALMNNRYEQQKQGSEEFERLIAAEKRAETETIPQWRALRTELAESAARLARQRENLNVRQDNPARKTFQPQIGQAQARANPPAANELKPLNLHQLYTVGDVLEGLAVEEYRDLRAIELSQLREMPFDRARRNIDAPKPERTALNEEELTGTPVSVAGLERQKTAIRAALTESGRMREYCRSLVQMLLTQDAGAEAALYQKVDPEHPDQEPDEGDLVTMEDIVQTLREMLQAQVEPMQKLAGLTETARQTPDAAKNEVTAGDVNADAAVELLAQALDGLDDDVRRPEDLNKAAAALKIAAGKLEQTAGSERAAEGKSRQEQHPLAEKTARAAAAAAEALQEQMEGMAEAADGFSKMKMVSANSPGALRKRMLKARAMAAAAAGTLSESVDLSGLMKSDPSQFGKGGDNDQGDSASGRNKNGKDGTSGKNGKAGRDGKSGQGERGGKEGDGATVWQRLNLKTNVPHPSIDLKTEGISGGRVLAGDGIISSTWMAVDSWYVIGPWANPGRMNIDKKYPPENSIDLGASYAGKDGRVLRWQFMQAPSVMLQPTDPTDYAIYYLYTEIRSDRDRDIWLVTGSDDKSKIWINDMLIWESRPELKAWRIGEGFRKVHLRKGVNRILYRLENGWYAVAMSLLFSTGQTLAEPDK